MKIKWIEIKNILQQNNIIITGALHIGAHDCEEMSFYNNGLQIPKDDIIWIDAIEEKFICANYRKIPNFYHAVITDKDDQDIMFNIANNGQSSSVLELGTHKEEHPDITYVDKIMLKSITIDTFFQKHNMDCTKYNFWNFDIQGAELMALKGAINSIKYAQALYLEINEKELYKNCGLVGEIDEFLLQHNFKRVLTHRFSNPWGDAFYIKKELING